MKLPRDGIKIKYAMIIFKGRKKGMVHTQNIRLRHLRAVFFPKDFHERFRYLGAIPYQYDSEMTMLIKSLVIAMDHYAKPRFCPRWFLRFLHLFGNDNSIIRVRNFRLYRLHSKLTRGIMMRDWKTKWHDYDLRISISAPQHLQSLSDSIERYVWDRGFRKELVESIKKRDPDFDNTHWTTGDLAKYADKLIENEEE
jgi:hypothetical protein